MPDLFGKEGHEGTEEAESGLEDSGEGGEGKGSSGIWLGSFCEVETEFDEFEVPVTKLAPEKLVDGVRGFIEAIVGEGAIDFDGDGVETVEDPASFEWRVFGESPRFCSVIELVGWSFNGDFVTCLAGAVEVHEEEAGRVPDLVGECAIAFGAGFTEGNVGAGGGHGGEGKPDGVGAEALDDIDWVDDVALGLGHLLAVGVADQAVDVNLFERNRVGEGAFAAILRGNVEHEVTAEHDHTGDPEEEDVEAGDEECGWIERCEIVGERMRIWGPGHGAGGGERGPA